MIISNEDNTEESTIKLTRVRSLNLLDMIYFKLIPKYFNCLLYLPREQIPYTISEITIILKPFFIFVGIPAGLSVIEEIYFLRRLFNRMKNWGEKEIERNIEKRMFANPDVDYDFSFKKVNNFFEESINTIETETSLQKFRCWNIRGIPDFRGETDLQQGSYKFAFFGQAFTYDSMSLCKDRSGKEYLYINCVTEQSSGWICSHTVTKGKPTVADVANTLDFYFQPEEIARMKFLQHDLSEPHNQKEFFEMLNERGIPGSFAITFKKRFGNNLAENVNSVIKRTIDTLKPLNSPDDTEFCNLKHSAKLKIIDMAVETYNSTRRIGPASFEFLKKCIDSEKLNSLPLIKAKSDTRGAELINWYKSIVIACFKICTEAELLIQATGIKFLTPLDFKIAEKALDYILEVDVENYNPKLLEKKEKINKIMNYANQNNNLMKISAQIAGASKKSRQDCKMLYLKGKESEFIHEKDPEIKNKIEEEILYLKTDPQEDEIFLQGMIEKTEIINSFQKKVEELELKNRKKHKKEEIIDVEKKLSARSANLKRAKYDMKSIMKISIFPEDFQTIIDTCKSSTSDKFIAAKYILTHTMFMLLNCKRHELIYINLKQIGNFIERKQPMIIYNKEEKKLREYPYVRGYDKYIELAKESYELIKDIHFNKKEKGKLKTFEINYKSPNIEERSKSEIWSELNMDYLGTALNKQLQIASTILNKNLTQSSYDKGLKSILTAKFGDEAKALFNFKYFTYEDVIIDNIVREKLKTEILKDIFEINNFSAYLKTNSLEDIILK